MLTFVGLGLYDLRDISQKGLDCIRRADTVFLELYTSRLMGNSVPEMEAFYGKPITVLSRDEVEQQPEKILIPALSGHVAFLTGGDPMVSTTHVDLRIRALQKGVATSIIHGSSIASAICGLTGLQNYRFGKSCSLPFPSGKWAPLTPAVVVQKNLTHDLHTLVYLDILENCCMTIPDAVSLLQYLAQQIGFEIPLYIGVARAGSDKPVVAAGIAEKLRAINFGPPLHVLIVPASLHIMEQEYLELFAGL